MISKQLLVCGKFKFCFLEPFVEFFFFSNVFDLRMENTEIPTLLEYREPTALSNKKEQATIHLRN